MVGDKFLYASGTVGADLSSKRAISAVLINDDDAKNSHRSLRSFFRKARGTCWMCLGAVSLCGTVIDEVSACR